jgi:hypothetical protein
VASWALDLSELVKFFLIVILNFLLLILFSTVIAARTVLLSKIESFFFKLASLNYFLRAFRLHLCLAFFLIDFVIGGLDLNIVLHAFLQETFVIKSLEHLDQWSNIILVHNIFLNVERLYALWDLCLPFFLIFFQRILFRYLWLFWLHFGRLIFGFIFLRWFIMVRWALVCESFLLLITCMLLLFFYE